MEIQRSYGVLLFIVAIAIFFLFMFIQLQSNKTKTHAMESKFFIELPSPMLSSRTSTEEALKLRRSIRAYKNQSLNLKEVAQLLWAAQGITSKNGFRTTPSAGALYPLEIYLVAGRIEGLSPGVYHYTPVNHALEKITNGDVRLLLAEASLGQENVKLAPANIVITAIFSRTTKKYGQLGRDFVLMEAGHAAQNIYLQSVSLKLGTVCIGAFDRNGVKKALVLQEEPLYILPLGKI